MKEDRWPPVEVLVLNYNGKAWLQRCLRSVLESDYPEFRVSVVDNGSSDGSAEFVCTAFPTVGLIELGSNMGFAKAYNSAVQNSSADYIVLLNNDTQVLSAHWLRDIVHTAMKDERAAVVGCKLVTMNDFAVLDSVGVTGIPCWRGFVDLGRYERDRGQYDDANAFSACGAAMLILRPAFLEVGGFDADFFAFMEDVDLCWRLRLKGYRVLFAPTAKVAHYFSGTFHARESERLTFYLSHRNVLRSIIKNCSSTLHRALRCYILYSLLLASGFAFLSPGMAWSVVKALLWNIRHLRETLRIRKGVQVSRKADDASIEQAMFRYLGTYRPKSYATARRVLDLLFAP
jgi:GT2 family glycosyltransferase